MPMISEVCSYFEEFALQLNLFFYAIFDSTMGYFKIVL